MMDTFTFLGNGLLIALTPANLIYTLIGCFVGTAVGVLPGLGPAATVALLLPITYKINPTSGVMMLAGIYYGAMYGGATTAILLNIPGEPSSVVTCFDGHKMARQGRAGVALGTAALSSFCGGTMSLLGLTLVAPSLASFALKFGYAEYTSLVIMGLVLSIYLSKGSVLKGLLACALGALLASVGVDPIYGVERFTFGILPLVDGIDFVVVAMGLFGISEVLCNLAIPEGDSIFKTTKTALRDLLPSREDWRRIGGPIARGSMFGFCIGILPGGGAIISSFVSYVVEKKISKEPERFGNGAIEGVASPEASSNASSTASFIPLLTLGIPGNATMAMIFVALMIHGVRPGPLMLQDHPSVFWGLIGSMYVGNMMLLCLNLPLIGMWVRFLKVPYHYIAVAVLVICSIGAYTVKNNVFDVGMMIVFGVIGFLMKQGGVPPAPLLLSMILVPILERSANQALTTSGGDLTIFLTRPISAAMLMVAIFMLLSPLFRWFWNRNRGRGL